MHGDARQKVTCAQLKCLHAKRRSLKVAVALEKLKGCAWGRAISDPAQGDVWVEKADIEGKSCREQGVIDLLAQLIESRVGVADSDPNDPGGRARREGADSSQREQKRLNPDAIKARLDRIYSLSVDVTEKPKRQMKLSWPGPDYAAHRVA